MNRIYYFPNIIRKCNIAIMNLFSGLQVGIYDNTKTLIGYRNVPIVYGQKQRFLPRRDKEGHKDFSRYLPRVSTIISSFSLNTDMTRGGHLSELYRYHDTSSDAVNRLYGGTPYTIGYTISLLSFSISEMSMMLEQVLPNFNPFKTVTIKEFDYIPDFTRDIKFTLGQISPNFQEEIDQTQYRTVEFDLNISVDCWIYKPILISDIVKSVNIDMIDQDTLKTLTTYTYSVSGDENSYEITEDLWDDNTTAALSGGDTGIIGGDIVGGGIL